MKAIWQGQVVAESNDVREIGGYIYFPRSTVRMERLTASSKTDSDLTCPHGVQFYDVSGDGQSSKRSAWSYEAPGEQMKQIDHWVGFWRCVEIK